MECAVRKITRSNRDDEAFKPRWRNSVLGAPVLFKWVQLSAAYYWHMVPQTSSAIWTHMAVIPDIMTTQLNPGSFRNVFPLLKEKTISVNLALCHKGLANLQWQEAEQINPKKPGRLIGRKFLTIPLGTTRTTTIRELKKGTRLAVGTPVSATL